MNARPSFFAELKRRNVLRAVVLYAGAVWAFGQGLSQFSPALGLPDWATRWFLIAAAIGFPFWTAFAWLYEFTPQGLKRESDIAPGESITHQTGRKLDFWIIGVLAVAVVLLLTNTFVWHKGTGSGTDSGIAAIPAKSIAVLPLTNEGGDKDQQYFSDGLSEELISALTQISALKVIGKYSSFQFRDSKDSPAQIGAKLGVAHLLEGSVRQQGDRVRIVVDLIKAADGRSVWSHAYDGDLKDVFAIQSQIGQSVVGALKVQLLGQTIITGDQPPSGNVQAYRLMLQGRAMARHQTEGERRRAIALFQQALQLDPDYAYAWAVLGNVRINLGIQYLHGAEQQAAYAQGRAAIGKALALAPDLPAAHISHAYLLETVDGDPLGALAEYRRALALAPNDGTSMMFVAGNLTNLGQLQASVDLYRRALATDPLRTDWYVNLSAPLIAQGQLDAAEQALHEALALEPDFPGAYSYLSQIDLLRGDAAAAQRNAQSETDPDLKAAALALAAQLGRNRAQTDAALRDYIARHGDTQPYNVADLYALRRKPDQVFEWLDRAWTARDSNLSSLLYDPLLLRYKDDPRFAAFCRKIGLPPPGTVVKAPAAAAASASASSDSDRAN